MSERFKTAATVDSPHEAYLIKALLESNDIEVRVLDEHVSGIGYSQAVGGVKVQVKDSDLDEVMKLLNQGLE